MLCKIYSKLNKKTFREVIFKKLKRELHCINSLITFNIELNDYLKFRKDVFCMYKNILLPYDFGNSFDNVPDQLVKLTDNSKDSMITIFNVISENEMADNVKYQGKHFDDIAKERVGDLKHFTDELDARGLNYKIYFETGRILAELQKEIESNEYEIVVMSNKRSKMNIKYVLGHVTHKVAKRANIPVMIIK